MPVEKVCPTCHAIFRVRPSEAHRRRCCSLRCEHQHRRSIDRFWPKINRESGHRVPGMESDCWLWTAGRFTQGYGCIQRQRTGKVAHRIAWELTYGPIPAGICVLHRCDEPRCCRPDHLFLGTTRDNVEDMLRKRRERWGSARLTAEVIQQIRDLHRDGAVSNRFLAARFGVTPTHIGYIVKRRVWKYI